MTRIPDARLGRQALEADFTYSPRASPAHPDHAELSFILTRLYFEDFSRPNLTAHALYHRASNADISRRGQLHEGEGMRIHAPDANGQKHCDSRIATTIHFLGKRLLVIVRRSQPEENLLQLRGKGIRSHSVSHCITVGCRTSPDQGASKNRDRGDRHRRRMRRLNLRPRRNL
jgi:hypothetical protein